MTHKCFCLDSRKKRGVHVCEAWLCEQGGDGARGRSLTLWEPRLVEWAGQRPSCGAHCLLGGKEGTGRYWTKEEKSFHLRKRAIKPATSWYSEKLSENNPSYTFPPFVSTQRLASDVKLVKWESVCVGRQLTFDLGVWETMTAAANMSLLHRGTDWAGNSWANPEM